MTDEDFIRRLQTLNAKGKDGVEEMRQVLKDSGGMERLLAIAARGVGIKVDKLQRSLTMTRIADDFPDAEAKDAALEYWKGKRRPDLVARIEEIAEAFHTHHFVRNNRFNGWGRVWKTWYVGAVNKERPPLGMPMAVVVDLHADPATWLRRLSIFHYGDEDNGQEVGFWSMKWGPKPGQLGCQLPAEAAAMFETKKQARLL